MQLTVIITSTRPGRVGKPVGDWFLEHARAHPAGFDDIVTADLAEIDLPIFNEPKHPAMQDYQHDHTKSWSKVVGAADAYVFVIPEYNYNPPPSFYNALNYLVREWNYKPAGFVSYGGVSGGIRATEAAKGILTTLKIVPVLEQVMIPGVGGMVKDGQFQPSDIVSTSADTMLAELSRWAKALAPLRIAG